MNTVVAALAKAKTRFVAIGGQAVSITLAISLCFAFTGCNRGRTGKSLAVFNFESAVESSFGGWRFFWGGTEEFGFPIWSFLNLYAEKNKLKFQIDSPRSLHDLGGLEIKSEEEAVVLLRLFTRPESYHRFAFPRAVEVQSEQPTSVTYDGKNYVVARQLFFKNANNSFTVARFTEAISKTGKYSVIQSNYIRAAELNEVMPFLPKE